MSLIQYYQITCQPVNQAFCIFIIVPIVLCNLVSIKCIIIVFKEHSLSFSQLFSSPHASAPYNAIGTISPSDRHFLAFILNPLVLSTLFSTSHALYPSFILCTVAHCHMIPPCLSLSSSHLGTFSLGRGHTKSS